MDYKFLILLALLFFIIMFFKHEFDIINKNINNKHHETMLSLNNNSKSLGSKMQNDIGVCIGKIKSLNCDYIEQVRKMNDYGSQPITNMSNNYTDSETLDGKKNAINYLSDTHDNQHNKTNFVIEFKQDELISPSKLSDHENLSKSEKSIDSRRSIKLSKTNNFDKLNESIKHTELVESVKSAKFAKSDKSIELSELSKSLELSESAESSKSSSELYCTTESSTSGDVVELNDESSNSEKSDVKNDDNHSVKTSETTDLQNLTLSSLGPSSKYTAETIKKMAVNLSIPITMAVGGKRVVLKKNELYDRIKLYLEKKEKI